MGVRLALCVIIIGDNLSVDTSVIPADCDPTAQRYANTIIRRADVPAISIFDLAIESRRRWTGGCYDCNQSAPTPPSDAGTDNLIKSIRPDDRRYVIKLIGSIFSLARLL